MGKGDTPGFADLIEQAQRRPSTANARDISNPFKVPLPEDHDVVNLEDSKIPGVPKYDYKAHVEHLVLPSDCERYETILNEVLNARSILRYEDRSFTKEGDCIVVIVYITYTPKPKPVRPFRRDEDDDEVGG